MKRTTIATPAAALELVRTHGLVTLTRAGELPCFVEAVAGEPVRGSWWGHPRGKLIFNLSESLADATEEVLVAKVVAGKVTFVHAALWPALLRVVTDAGFRTAQSRGLPEAARALLARVEQEGEVRATPAEKTAARALDTRLLVLSASVHTERGSHATVLRSWARWATPEVRRAAKALGLTDARAALAAAGPPLAPG